MRSLKGLWIIEEKKSYVFLADEVLGAMIKRINEKSNLSLTKRHISLASDPETNRFLLAVNEDEFTEEEWVGCVYNIQECYETFDQLLYEILEVPNEQLIDVYHRKYEDSDDYVIVTFNEGSFEHHEVIED